MGSFQEQCQFRVFQGEGQEINLECVRMIGEFTVPIPPREEKIPLRIGLVIDANGILLAHATEEATGQKVECNFNYADSTQLSPQELAEKKKRHDADLDAVIGQRSVFAPHRSMDRVHFSLTSPPTIEPGASQIIDVWAHLDHQRWQVVERAREEAGGTGARIKSKGPVKLERGTVLAVRLQIDGATIVPEEDTILWEGEIGNVSFAVTIETTAAEGPRVGFAYIYANGFQVARMSFAIRVGPRSVAPERLPSEERHFRAAFASYASADEDAVLARVQGLRKAAPGMNVFFARKDISSGENWRERLAQEIATRDVMYLFWSQAASDSECVDWEWRSGLNTRGIGFIDPFPLVDPEVVAPPPELAAELHFGDWELAYIRASSASRSRRMSS